MSSQTFKKVFHGGALFTMGSIFGNVLQFVAGIIVIRIVTPSEYGLIALATMVTTFVVGITTLGINTGLPRFISKVSISGRKHSFSSTVGTALVVLGATSSLTSIIYCLAGNSLAEALNKPEVGVVLRTFSFMVLPLAVIEILSSIFRGLEEVKPNIIFNNIFFKALRIIMFTLIAILGLGFGAVTLTYVLSAWLVLIFFSIYSSRRLRGSVSIVYRPSIAKELILFSLPLLGVSIMGNMMAWAGTLSISYFQSAEEIAFFNAPLRLASFISLPLLALVYIYMPVATQLIHTKKDDNLMELYTSTTKWAFFLALPLVLILLIDANYILTILFGEKYAHSGNILRLLIVGYSVHSFLGPNGSTLVAFGETRKLFVGSFLAVVSTIILCLILVPYYGAVGAALGATIGQIVSNTYYSLTLNLSYRIHPFSRNYIAPLSFIAVAWFTICAVNFVVPLIGWPMHLLFYLLIVSIVFLSPFITRSISNDDIVLLRAIEQRIQGNTQIVDWLANKVGYLRQ